MACCGLSGKGMVSMVGLLIFLFFAVIFGGIGLVVLSIPSVFSMRVRVWFVTLWTLLSVSIPNMFGELFKNAYFWRPEFKCIVSGRLFKLSPAFSGLVFKYFNFFIFVVIVGAVIILIGTLMRVVS